jgi:hypothetical protein
MLDIKTKAQSWCFMVSLRARKGDVSMKRMVIGWFMVLLVISTITVSAAEADSIAGTWNVNCNSYTGRMEIRRDSGGYSGRLYLQGKWEEMLDLTVDGNRITFFRASVDQLYRGRISGTIMQGNFNQQGRGKYPWKAHLRGAR